MKFSVLCSSSSGNCTLLKVNNKNYLLDAGISARGLKEKLNYLNEDLDNIEGIFVTHEHTDHIYGLASIAKKYSPAIYLTKNTYKSLSDADKEKISPILFKFIKCEEDFYVDDLHILPFRISHDAKDPVGYKFEYNNKVLVYLTDTGVFIPRDDLKNADSYILESNHEPDMLVMSGRPWVLINRILSNTGHLSNQDSAKLFSELVGEKTQSLVLFHLSSECNTKDLALLAYKYYFKEKNQSIINTKITVSDKKIPTKFIEV